MELKRDEIIKALECCQTTSEMDCIDCPYRNKGNALYAGCVNSLVVDALALIKELTEQVEKDNKTFIDLYHEAETYLAQRDCLRNQVKNLTEENERMRAPRFLASDNGTTELIPSVESVRADTVRKMHSEIKERCIKGGIYPAFVARVIEQVAKEMLEGVNANGNEKD